MKRLWALIVIGGTFGIYCTAEGATTTPNPSESNMPTLVCSGHFIVPEHSPLESTMLSGVVLKLGKSQLSIKGILPLLEGTYPLVLRHDDPVVAFGDKIPTRSTQPHVIGNLNRYDGSLYILRESGISWSAQFNGKCKPGRSMF